jgi:hypothetical protein
VLYALTIFLSAFLLFQVQLIVAKHLLPWFGGAPAVWTTCQLFFQFTLLGGYGYAHLLAGQRSLRRQGFIHISLIATAVLALGLLSIWSGFPLLAPETMKPNGAEQPVPLLLGILALTVGLPFFVLSSTGPLLQRWHSHTTDSLDRTYRLYALSNAGSLLGLLSYPFGIERVLDLSQQAWVWAGLFAVYAFGCGTLALRTAQLAELDDSAAGPSPAVASVEPGTVSSVPGWLRPWLWLLLASCSSAMFLATTNQLSLEVAAVPFLWVLPLGLYLLTFIVCFDRPRWYSSHRRWFILAAAGATLIVSLVSALTAGLPIPYQVAAYGSFLFLFCFVCHGELVRLRPDASRLTQFYLLIAVGGAMGGGFVGLAAPAWFVDVWEFHVIAMVGWILLMIVWFNDRESAIRRGDRWHFAFLAGVVCIMAAHFIIAQTGLVQTRLVARFDWRVPLLIGAVIASIVFVALWRTRLVAGTIWARGLFILLLLAVGMSLSARVRKSGTGKEFAARNFYGVVRVQLAAIPPFGLGVKQLVDGNTIHGVQMLHPGQRNLPTSYYSPSTGIAATIRYLTQRNSAVTEGNPRSIHFGILGKGTGAMAGFARTGDLVRYYELNPTVIQLSEGPQPHFTFVRDCAGEVTILAGDGRLTLERELAGGQPQGFDLLAMDAFSSDAVPVHLLTEEAFHVYAAHLRDDKSILAVNITNRHLDLEPVVTAAARRLGFHGVRVDTKGDPPVVQGSTWLLLCRNPQIFEHQIILEVKPRPLDGREVLFTDRYSNLFRVLK